ncbi:MAG: hypothetical protein JSV86_17090 [Gemmatimonadota bacterium]|nr:MAG: hypothetical protein JSV86_17090 [Gemmatimonadota bacterium]
MAMNYYWNDPTMDTSAVRGGKPGDPFNTGVLRFYNDRTLQYQAPRMGNLYGAGGTMFGAALPGTFTITKLASGLLKAVPGTHATTAHFAAVQFAANAAAAKLGLTQRIKVTSEIDPPTAELILTIAQKAPTHPALAALAQLTTDPATAMTNAVPFIATRGDLIDALNTVQGPGMSRGTKIALIGGLAAMLVVGGVMMRRAYA